MITVPQWRRSGWRLLSMMTPCQQRVIDREKMLLLNVRQLLDPLLEPSTSDLSTISSSIRHLDELFCITVIGEFNSGKSTFVNALLGQRVCDEGVTPTTSAVATIRYDRNASPTHTSASSLDSTALVCVTAPWLKDAVIVDTPGTNAIVTGHQQITEEIIPRSDLVFFITSIDRPFSESERLFMSKIHEWKRKIVVVINKIDMLDHISRKSDLDKVVQFVRANTQQLLQLTPPIFTVSGKAELFARLNGKNDANSGFSELQKFINQTLSDVEKMQLKLENPLAVVERLLDKYVGALEKKIAHVKMEKDVIDKVNLVLFIFDVFSPSNCLRIRLKSCVILNYSCFHQSCCLHI
uniref:Dynamin N-terminal domain-containing protein n=1 Tax=Spongospora subterranea TaxID=70186 RepID=A0A0H5QHR2_9EUKA|eukprot:CRZ01192.1 hypothetical protein [Spongospora subterranea]